MKKYSDTQIINQTQQRQTNRLIDRQANILTDNKLIDIKLTKNMSMNRQTIRKIQKTIKLSGKQKIQKADTNSK